jgi:hypothetical protein
LDESKLEILKKITPALGEAAVPIDLFDHDLQYAFTLKVDRPYGHWSLLAVFNPSLTETVARQFPLERLGLDPMNTYVGFDFWKQQLSALFRDYDSFSLKLVDRHIVRVHLRFGASDKLRWEIRYDEFLR